MKNTAIQILNDPKGDLVPHEYEPIWANIIHGLSPEHKMAMCPHTPTVINYKRGNLFRTKQIKPFSFLTFITDNIWASKWQNCGNFTISALAPEIMLWISIYFNNLFFTGTELATNVFFFFLNNHRRADKCVDAAIWETFTAARVCVLKCCVHMKENAFWCSVCR